MRPAIGAEVHQTKQIIERSHGIDVKNWKNKLFQ
jgi:hypothetical protein